MRLPWGDGRYVEFLPEGITQLEGIGIEILTNAAFDWHLENLFFYTQKTDTPGAGTFQLKKIGTPVPHARQRTTALGSYASVTLPRVSNVTDRVRIVFAPVQYCSTDKDTGVETCWIVMELQKSPLSVTSIPVDAEVWVYDYETITATLADNFEDFGGHAISNIEFPETTLFVKSVQSVENVGGEPEAYRILRYNSEDKAVTIDVSSRTLTSFEQIKIVIVKKLLIDPENYTITTSLSGKVVVAWTDNAWTSANSGKTFRCTYPVSGRSDSVCSLALIGDRQVRDVSLNAANVDENSPGVAIFSRIVMLEQDNTVGRGQMTICPIRDGYGSHDGALQEMYLDTLKMATTTRQIQFTETPMHWGTTPHISFGGELMADEPLHYMGVVTDKLTQGNVTNIIVAGGGLNAAKVRMTDYWWGWGNAVHDSGVSYIDVMRTGIRKDISQSVLAQRLSQFNYFIEVTIFNSKWLRINQNHIGIGPDGAIRFGRSWYYEMADGVAYRSINRAVHDFSPAYYDPIVEDGNAYDYQYHYLTNYPGFWTCTTLGARWGGDVVTILDQWLTLAGLYADQYDCAGVICSELIVGYKYSYSPNDLILYNEWRQASGLSALIEFARKANGDYDCDDETLWSWKVWQTNYALGLMADMLHAHGKLLGASVEVDSFVSMQNKDSPAWDGINKFRGADGAWYTRDLSKNSRRYGQDYAAMLQDGRADFLYAWLYYRYSPEPWWREKPDTVDDFIEAYPHLRERMMVSIGLYPSSNPPDSVEEVEEYIGKLSQAGYQVAYPGWPRVITTEKYQPIWDWFSDYTPEAVGAGALALNPKHCGAMPFYLAQGTASIAFSGSRVAGYETRSANGVPSGGGAVDGAVTLTFGPGGAVIETPEVS